MEGVEVRTDAASDRRRYRSHLREQQAEQTRRKVVEAAHDLFVDRGWVGTGMRDVARSAGVAIETVYSHFSSKRGLLLAVIDAVGVGDDAPVPLAERPEFLAIGEGRRPARIRAAARLTAAAQTRTAAVARMLREAAPADEEIAEILRALRGRQRADVSAALELILGRTPTPIERDGVWAVVSNDVCDLLMRDSGWTAQQYELWIEATLERVIPRS